MRAVILGASGMLGRALQREFPAARPLTLDDLDIRDTPALSLVIRSGVDLVLNAAADTRVDLAETDDGHLTTNDVAVGVLARLCQEVNACLVHVSTDYIFGGDATRPYLEDDPVNPINAYGRGKLAGEEKVRESGVRALIVRTSWVFGAGGVNFPDTILNLAEGGRKTLRVVTDQVGRPTYAVDLARAIRILLEKNVMGTVHFANSGAVGWFDLAAETLQRAGFRDVSIEACLASEFPRPARRPGYSVLDTSRYEALTGTCPRPYTLALDDYLAERKRSMAPGPS